MMNWSGKPWRYWQLAIVAIAVLLTSISGCRQLSLTSERSSISQDKHIVAFVPKQALLSAVIDTTAKLDKTWLKSSLSEGLFKTADSFLASLSLDFDDDIRPWLGNTLAFAITDKDIDRDRRNGRQTGYLLAVDTTDGDHLREFLELFWQRQAVAGAQPVLSNTSGVPVVTGQVGAGEQSLATAVVGPHTLLIANDIKVLQQSLRVAQIPTLQLSDYDCCTPIWVNLHLPELLDWLGLAVPIRQQLLSSPQWQQLQAQTVFQPHRLVINMQLNSLGNRVDPTLNSRLTGTREHKDSIQKYLPTSLAWVATGYDLMPLWLGLADELNHYQKLPVLIQQSQQWLSTPLAQTLIEKITQLFINHYAVGQFQDGTWLMAMANTQIDMVKQLDDIAIQQGLTVSQLTLNNQTVTAWSRLKTRVKDGTNRETTVETDLVALHTKVEDCDIFSSSIGGLTAALEAPDQPLFKNQQFQKVVQPTDNSNQGYAYGTWGEIERLLASNRWFSLIKPILQPWSESLSAISVSTNGKTGKQSTGTISILLKD